MKMTWRRFAEIVAISFLTSIVFSLGCRMEHDSLRKSEELLQSHMAGEAANLLEKIVQSNGKNAKARMLLGRAYDELGRFRDAVFHLKKASYLYGDQLEPRARVRLKLATIFMKLGNREEGYAELRAIVRSSSDDAMLQAVAGVLGDAYQVVRLTDGDDDNYSPTFSPDGRRIAFSSFRLDNGEIYLMDLDGRIHQRVTYTPNINESSPAFLSDANYLIYGSEPKTSREIKIVLQTSGSTPMYGGFKVTHVYSKITQEVLPVGFGVRVPRVSSNRSQVIYEANTDGNVELYFIDFGVVDIQAINPDLIRPQRITHNKVDDGSPCFFPDGSRIVFVSAREQFHQLYTVNMDGSTEQRLNPNQYDCYSPMVSPDGNTITFVSTRDGDIEIYMMNADGTGERRVTNGIGVSIQPNFSPDGRKLLFTSDRSDNFQIYLMFLDEAVTRRQLLQKLEL